MFVRVTKSSLLNTTRKLSSDSEVNSWLKIYGSMRKEAGEIAETAVSSTKLDVAVLRTEVGAIKTDVAQVKTDVASLRAEVKADVNDLRKGQIDLHKEMTSNTRLLLVAMFGTASLFFGANRYLDDNKGNKVVPKL